MNLEDIKEWRETAYLSFDTIPEISRIDWLIAEVELMQKQLDFIEEEGEVKTTAQRCVEVIKHEAKEVVLDRDTVTHLLEAIRKEFDL